MSLVIYVFRENFFIIINLFLPYSLRGAIIKTSPTRGDINDRSGFSVDMSKLLYFEHIVLSRVFLYTNPRRFIAVYRRKISRDVSQNINVETRFFPYLLLHCRVRNKYLTRIRHNVHMYVCMCTYTYVYHMTNARRGC